MTITRRQLVQAFGASAALGALHPFAAHAQVDQVKVYFGFPAGSLHKVARGNNPTPP